MRSRSLLDQCLADPLAQGTIRTVNLGGLMRFHELKNSVSMSRGIVLLSCSTAYQLKFRVRAVQLWMVDQCFGGHF